MTRNSNGKRYITSTYGHLDLKDIKDIMELSLRKLRTGNCGFIVRNYCWLLLQDIVLVGIYNL